MIGKGLIFKPVQTQHGYAVLTKIVPAGGNGFHSNTMPKLPRSLLTKPTRCLIGARKLLSRVHARTKGRSVLFSNPAILGAAKRSSFSGRAGMVDCVPRHCACDGRANDDCLRGSARWSWKYCANHQFGWFSPISR